MVAGCPTTEREGEKRAIGAPSLHRSPGKDGVCFCLFASLPSCLLAFPVYPTNADQELTPWVVLE
jgi:hypothetical protein